MFCIMAAINDISSRFIEALNELLKRGILQDKKSFATSVGSSTSMITELSKGRSNVGVSLLQGIVMHYGISADWLLTGQGNMLKSDAAHPPQYTGTQEMLVSDEPVQYNTGHQETMVDKLLGIIDKKDNIIREQAEDIGHLRSELEQLKQRLQSSASTTPETPPNVE